MQRNINIQDYKFSDLVDIAAFEKLLESLFKITGIPSGLIADDGKVLSEVGWVSACVDFHRANPKTNQSCHKSNVELMQSLHDGKVACSLCKNGLIDCATPVVVEGHRLATIFLGQVLNKTPNMTFFKKLAGRVGFEESAYLEAIRAVPVVSKEQLNSIMDSMVGMAHMLAKNALASLRENSIQNDLNQSKEKQVQLEDILDSSPVGIGWSHADGKIEYLNRQFTQLFGYTREDIPDLDTWYQKAYPDSEYRKAVIEPWKTATSSAHKIGESSPELEVNITCKDGSVRRVLIRVSWVGEKFLANFNDITAHWQSEQRNRAHDGVLEMVAKGSPLSEILHAIVNVIESEDNSAMCSILLLDKDKKHLHNGAAPSLPTFYNEAIEGIEIGMGVGSCGTAAYLAKRVVVEDIMTHEYWQPYTELAQRAGIGACWSEPIISSEHKVLGTFAIYHAKPTTPGASDMERIKFAANIAAVAIENRDARTELEQQAYFDYLTELANRRYFIEKAEAELLRHDRYDGNLSLMMFDVDHFKQINDTYGHGIGDLVLQKIADICRNILRDVDIIGRIGGEEFAILLPHTNVIEAQKVAERLRIAISKGEIAVDESARPKFTASFGVVDANEEATNIDKLLKQADSALYEAKENGRNRVCVAKKDTAVIQ